MKLEAGGHNRSKKARQRRCRYRARYFRCRQGGRPRTCIDIPPATPFVPFDTAHNEKFCNCAAAQFSAPDSAQCYFSMLFSLTTPCTPSTTRVTSIVRSRPIVDETAKQNHALARFHLDIESLDVMVAEQRGFHFRRHHGVINFRAHRLRGRRGGVGRNHFQAIATGDKNGPAGGERHAEDQRIKADVHTNFRLRIIQIDVHTTPAKTGPSPHSK